MRKTHREGNHFHSIPQVSQPSGLWNPRPILQQDPFPQSPHWTFLSPSCSNQNPAVLWPFQVGTSCSLELFSDHFPSVLPDTPQLIRVDRLSPCQHHLVTQMTAHHFSMILALGSLPLRLLSSTFWVISTFRLMILPSAIQASLVPWPAVLLAPFSCGCTYALSQ